MREWHATDQWESGRVERERHVELEFIGGLCGGGLALWNIWKRFSTRQEGACNSVSEIVKCDLVMMKVSGRVYYMPRCCAHCCRLLVGL